MVHSLSGTAANVADIAQAHALLHGEEKEVFADAGYPGVEKREEIAPSVRRSSGMWPPSAAKSKRWPRAWSKR